MLIFKTWLKMKNERSLLRNRTQYRRLLRHEFLESRALMAANVFDVAIPPEANASLFAEGESVAPVLGFMPQEPAELVAQERAKVANGAKGPDAADPPGAIPLANTFLLHSRPTAKKTIYIDFDGFTAKGTSWNSSYNIDPIVSPPYDPDNNGAAFTNNELLQIQGVWQRVAADFAPFDVNVTTEDPGEANLVNTGGSDDRWGMRAVVTLVNFSNLPIGGFAYIGSFNWNYENAGATDTPCYIFNSTSMSVAAAVSHEVGHSIGLSHDGTTSANTVQGAAEYYNGHGSGENSWGPIMGSGYYKNVTTWDDGTYLGTSNGASNANFGSGPLDLTVITQQNGFGFTPDDNGNSVSAATTLVGASIPGGRQSLSMLGSIEQSSDLDFFKFQTGSGTVDITIDPYVNQIWTSNGNGGFTESVESSFLDGTNWDENQGSNLDVEATIYDSSGNVIAVSNPNGLRASFTNLNLTVGTYYLRVDGVGFGNPKADPPTGYSDYGSVGQYQITGTVVTAIEINIPDTGPTFTENSVPVLISTLATITDSVIPTYDGGVLSVEVTGNYQTGDVMGLASQGNNPGEISTDSNNYIYFGGVSIGTLKVVGPLFTATFSSTATRASIEAVIRNITFEHTTDGPTSNIRQVSFFLDNGAFGASNHTSVLVSVTPLNDAPIVGNAAIPAVSEDTKSPAGVSVAKIVAPVFMDPDNNGIATGVVITSNNETSAKGVWQYSINGNTWAPVLPVSQSAGLILSPQTLIRFVPAKDYFGTPAGLTYRVLDNTYSGVFTTATQQFLNTSVANPTGFLSMADRTIGTQILPVNDPPVALVALQALSVDEDTPLSATIPSGWFTDVDDSVLVLSGTRADGSPLPAWVNFNPADNTFSGTPTNDDVGVSEFAIRATDSAGAFTVVRITLTVINVNDTPTNINLATSPIRENLVGTFVGTLFGTDPDSADTLTWTIDDPRFEAVGNLLYLKSGKSLDFEQEKTVNLLVRATDNGVPPLFLESSQTITTVDENEFSPALPATSFVITEDTLGGTSIGILDALDADTANTVRFRFVGTAPTLFKLNTVTGEVTLSDTAKLDYETKSSYQFFVEAMDNGLPQRSTAASVNVIIGDVNEFAPVINSVTAQIPENQVTNSAFFKVNVTDGDSKQTIRFELLPTENRFAINPNTGELSLIQNNLLDFENTQSLTVKIIATDSGLPPRSVQKDLLIQVTDANDPPTAASILNNNVLSNITGLDIGAILITDQDAGQQYFIESLDDRFVVVDGRLMVAPGKSLSETDPLQFDVPITVTETVTGAKTYPLAIRLNRTPNPQAWQNQVNALDTDRSGDVGPLDVLALVNAINAQTRTLPLPRPAALLGQPDYDVDGDGSLSPLDVLAVINFINSKGSPSGEGETSNSQSAIANQAISPDDWLSAFSQLEVEQNLRKKRS